jgi:hypothetical protein
MKHPLLYVASHLLALQTSFLEDGIIDADEVQKMQTEFKQYVTNDGIRSLTNLMNHNTEAVAGFGELCINAFKSTFLDDDGSPGAIDEEESQFLITVLGVHQNWTDIHRNVITALIKDSKISPVQSFLDYAASGGITK